MAEVTLVADGRLVRVHVPTTGRMGELLVAGARVHVSAVAGRARRTGFDLVLADGPAGPVCIDSRVPNRLLRRYWSEAPSPAGLAVSGLTPEPRHHRGRFDFRLVDEAGPMLVEVKSVTLVEGGVALFPDAPTRRGARHLDDLGAWARAGGRAAAVFVVQRADGLRVAPNRATDPGFADALARAAEAGVDIVGYGTVVTLEGIWIAGRLPVHV